MASHYRMTSVSWLDYGDNPDHYADIGIYKRFLPIWDGHNSTKLAGYLSNCYEISFWGMRCLTSSKPSDFVAGLDHNPDTGNFNRIF